MSKELRPQPIPWPEPGTPEFVERIAKMRAGHAARRARLEGEQRPLGQDRRYQSRREKFVSNGDRARAAIAFLLGQGMSQAVIAREIVRADSTVCWIIKGGNCTFPVLSALENLAEDRGYCLCPPVTAGEPPPALPSADLVRIEAKIDRLLALWEG